MTPLWLSVYYASMDTMYHQVWSCFSSFKFRWNHISWEKLYRVTLQDHITFSESQIAIVNSGVFKNFEKDGEFFCFAGQSTQAVTGMYNLNRASQISFPGEDILQRARNFSYEFLREREAQGTLHDKWIISKDLPGEV